MNLTLDLLLIPIAYLIGSISFAVVVSKCMRLPDPHSIGRAIPVPPIFLEPATSWQLYLL